MDTQDFGVSTKDGVAIALINGYWEIKIGSERPMAKFAARSDVFSYVEHMLAVGRFAQVSEIRIVL